MFKEISTKLFKAPNNIDINSIIDNITYIIPISIEFNSNPFKSQLPLCPNKEPYGGT